MARQHSFFYIYTFIYLFIFWLCWFFIAVRGLSLVAASGGYSSLQCAGFSLWWLLLLRSTGSRRVGFSSCGTQAQQLRHTGLVAPRHVGSSRTRARTHVPCIGRRILNHCAIREVPKVALLSSNSVNPLLCPLVETFSPWRLSSPNQQVSKLVKLEAIF